MKTLFVAAIALGISGFAGSAMADHNSLWGEGTALDPQGVHDNRYDTNAEDGDMSQFQGATVEGSDADFEITRSRPDTIDATGGSSLEDDVAFLMTPSENASMGAGGGGTVDATSGGRDAAMFGGMGSGNGGGAGRGGR